MKSARVISEADVIPHRAAGYRLVEGKLKNQEWAMHINPFSNPWTGLLNRTEGPLKFRFFLQPVMSIFLAVRGGLRDSLEGKPPYYWELRKDPAMRKQLLRDGWKSISTE